MIRSPFIPDRSLLHRNSATGDSQVVVGIVVCSTSLRYLWDGDRNSLSIVVMHQRFLDTSFIPVTSLPVPLLLTDANRYILKLDALLLDVRRDDRWRHYLLFFP